MGLSEVISPIKIRHSVIEVRQQLFWWLLSGISDCSKLAELRETY